MLRDSRDYLMVILFGLPAFALTQCYAGTCGKWGNPPAHDRQRDRG
jgi:hypothetical protein